jgi:hypothetical protein
MMVCESLDKKKKKNNEDTGKDLTEWEIWTNVAFLIAVGFLIYFLGYR